MHLQYIRRTTDEVEKTGTKEGTDEKRLRTGDRRRDGQKTRDGKRRETTGDERL